MALASAVSSDIKDILMNYIGTTFDDVITGTSANDSFSLFQGGDDAVSGGAGNDTFFYGSSFTGLDIVDGGAGNDIIDLDGDYSAGVTFGGGNVTSVETLYLSSGHNYNLTDNDLASRGTLTVDASSLTAGNYVYFNASAVSGRITATGGAGIDVLWGGHGSDNLNGGGGADQILPGSGSNTVNGGDGNDVVIFGTTDAFTANDAINGGTGVDLLQITGNYTAPIVFTATTVTNVEDIHVTGGSYDITLNDANVANNAYMDISGWGMTASQSLVVRGGAETGGVLGLGGGDGADMLIAGAGNDWLGGEGGADTLTGGAGYDIFSYEGGVTDSTSANFDHVTDFNAAQDVFALPETVTGVNATVLGGALSLATFDIQLATAVGAAQLGAYHAVLFEPTTGDQHGHTFLVVDANGIAGYQASQDYVIDVSGMTGTLATADFTHT
ncbi:MAG TPA: calcium-binding protein [Rhizomicrobium sp.]